MAADSPYFWIGQDGQYYVKSAATGWKVTQGGAASPATTSMYLSSGWNQIPDPSPTLAATTTTAPSNPTGTTAPVAKVFNQAGADNTQLAISQLPAILQAALSAEATKYQNARGVFDTQEGQQRKTYEDSTTNNQQNYDENYMDSIRAGIHGLGGLMQLLRGSGAAGGTVDDTVRDTVGGVTSNDIREGADTRKTNQTALDSSLSTFLTDLGLKRRQNEDTRTNNERAARRDSATQMQDLYGKMAGFYGDAGRTAEYNDWMSRAGSLTPEIAANSAAQVSPYDATPVTVQAPQLTAFAPPTQPSVLAAPEDGQVGSGIFTMSQPRRKELAPAGA